MISRGVPSTRDPAPDDGRIAAEPPLPVAVAEHHDFGAAVLVVALGERRGRGSAGRPAAAGAGGWR